MQHGSQSIIDREEDSKVGMRTNNTGTAAFVEQQFAVRFQQWIQAIQNRSGTKIGII
jgi:hypothetical protein